MMGNSVLNLSDWETLEANIDNLFWDKEAISTLGLVLNAYKTIFIFVYIYID